MCYYIARPDPTRPAARTSKPDPTRARKSASPTRPELEKSRLEAISKEEELFFTEFRDGRSRGRGEIFQRGPPPTPGHCSQRAHAFASSSSTSSSFIHLFAFFFLHQKRPLGSKRRGVTPLAPPVVEGEKKLLHLKRRGRLARSLWSLLHPGRWVDGGRVWVGKKKKKGSWKVERLLEWSQVASVCASLPSPLPPARTG